ncbi:SCF E3 ubiquitin ligase complex F-box protein grrA-like [Beta vulgaris subsp. vulgaris]|uniref:SCF E3 ubiquitin ligase complex F-box protein grrA-like n=1 Tax=Beta vulgaris subsp. vulgaris TaxID=3555 RepID=UPI0020371CB4|nr:SCF E3 ubiquitin ligase complex F-box protein grrA-like [Beta vulgaris subsp. vulgaris]
MAEETNTELLDECWDMIFKHLNHESDQDSISLVCKRFLSITNFSKVSIKVTSPSIQVLSRLLQRFTNLKKIQFCRFQGDLNKAVCAVAQSGLDLEELDIPFNESPQTVCFDELGLKMRNLKVLDYSGCLSDADLVKIANSFTQLVELQIGNPFNRSVVTDEGIDYLSSKLKRLRKIDFFFDNRYISDKSLVSLSSNYVFLEHITVSHCRNVTITGISFLINNSCYLKFLHLCEHWKIEPLRFTTFLPKLQILIFVNLSISDEFLYSIASARIPLTEFSLSYCEGYTFTGISRLLRSCHQSLKSLVLRVAQFLTDEHIEYLSSFLYNLTSIELFYCQQLSSSAFVRLTQSCPLLRHLEMSGTSLGKTKYDNDGMIKKNFAIKYLNLSSNSCLSTSCLKKLINICPKVEIIKLSCCFQGKEQLDVADILECNNGFLLGCQNLVVSLKDQKLSNLQKLVAKGSGMNDAMLAMIVRMCPGLIHLNLESCNNTTDEGVKEVVRLCKRLRYLSLSSCWNLDISIVAWIVSNSQSLRKLVSPSHKYPDEEEQKQFLQQGCLVSKAYIY